jgi:hypothetical protein
VVWPERDLLPNRPARPYFGGSYSPSQSHVEVPSAAVALSPNSHVGDNCFASLR